MNTRQIGILGLIAIVTLGAALGLRGKHNTARSTEQSSPSVPHATADVRQSTTPSAVASVDPVPAAQPKDGHFAVHVAQTPQYASPAFPKATPTSPPAVSSGAASVAAQTEVAGPTVSIALHDPDGTQSFSVVLKAGADACQVLEEAKTEGKIRSLTLDDSYKESFGSSYVREINGYSNNWTFAIDEQHPQGCSLYKPHIGDTIVWTFGA